jgi:hypothetical protein
MNIVFGTAARRGSSADPPTAAGAFPSFGAAGLTLFADRNGPTNGNSRVRVADGAIKANLIL